MEHKNSSNKLNIFESYVATANFTKKQKTEHLSTITLGYIYSKKSTKDKPKFNRMRILFDSGCAATLINSTLVKGLNKTRTATTNWSTKAGHFRTKYKCEIKFKMPAFYAHRDIEWDSYVETSSPVENRYDLIIGRDLLQELGIDLLFSENLIKWDTATIPMTSMDRLLSKNLNDFEHEILFMHDPESTEADRIQHILNAKYTPADLNSLARDCESLNEEQQNALLALLNKYKPVFDGSLGTWNTDPVELELKDPEAKPYHAKPYPVPFSQEKS